MPDTKDLYEGHSPSQGLLDGGATSPSGDPGPPSVFPDVNVYERGTDSPVGTAPAETFAGIGPTSGPGVHETVQIATGIPTEYSDQELGGTMVGGLGSPPRP